MGVYYSDHGRDLMKNLYSEAQLQKIMGEMKRQETDDQMSGQDWVRFLIWTAG